MYTIVPAVLTLFTLLMQELPAGEDIMKRVEEAAGKHQGIQYVFGISSEATASGKSAPAPPVWPTATVAAIYPGKMRIELGTSLHVTDGAATWAYDSTTKQYTKTAAGQQINPLAIVPMDWLMRVQGFPSISDVQGNPKTIREDALEIGGVKHECWVVRNELKIPEGGVPLEAASVTSWIDKELLIPLKNEMSVSQNAQNDLKIVMTLSFFKLDEAIADNKFTFTPPADSREVASSPSQLNFTGSSAPAFSGKDLEGNTYSLDSLKGKAVFLDFWTTWCGPCGQSTPALQRINAEFKDKGLVMLGIDVGEDRKVLEAYLKPRPVSYPVIMGSDFGIDHTFQIHAFPTFIVINPDGKIVAHELGYGEPGGEARLRGMVAKAFAAAPVPAAINTASNAVRTPGPPLPSYSPNAVTIDSGGNVYIGDWLGARIIKVSPAGLAVTFAGNSTRNTLSEDGVPAIFASIASATEGPGSIAADKSGSIYIAENGNNRIRKVTPDGIITTIRIPEFQRVWGLVVDDAGNLYISEAGANRVRKVTPAGEVTTIAGTGKAGSAGDGGPAVSAELASPTGLARDAAGNLYIADTANHRVRKVSADGTITLAAGNGSDGVSGDGGLAVLAQLKAPQSVAVDSAGNLYIADPLTYRIRKVTPNGTITTVAGNGSSGFAGDGGPAAQAQFAGVSNLAVDDHDVLYFADPGNFRVRKITANGNIDTVAGTAASVKPTSTSK